MSYFSARLAEFSVMAKSGVYGTALTFQGVDYDCIADAQMNEKKRLLETIFNLFHYEHSQGCECGRCAAMDQLVASATFNDETYVSVNREYLSLIMAYMDAAVAGMTALPSTTAVAVNSLNADLVPMPDIEFERGEPINNERK